MSLPARISNALRVTGPSDSEARSSERGEPHGSRRRLDEIVGMTYARTR